MNIPITCANLQTLLRVAENDLVLMECIDPSEPRHTAIEDPKLQHLAASRMVTEMSPARDCIDRARFFVEADVHASHRQILSHRTA